MRLKEQLKHTSIYNQILLRIDREKAIPYETKDYIEGKVLDYQVDCIGVSDVNENELLIDVYSPIITGENNTVADYINNGFLPSSIATEDKILWSKNNKIDSELLDRTVITTKGTILVVI